MKSTKVQSLRSRIAEVFPGEDRVVGHKDGTVTVKRSYFYRHGMDSQKWADNVIKTLAEAGITVSEVEHNDEWRAWPKTSYFTVTVREAETVIRLVTE